jgi:hypothetical protein
MEAVFHIKADEFDEFYVEILKKLLNNRKNLEITVAISDSNEQGVLRKETKDQYFGRLRKALEEINNGKGITIASDDFDNFSNQILNEP